MAVIDSVVRGNGRGVEGDHVRVIRSTIARTHEGGAGVVAVGSLVIRDSVIRGNREVGIHAYSVGRVTSRVTIEDTLIARNRASTRGGGMYRAFGPEPATTELRNVTFRGNSAAIDAGGLYNEDPGITLVDVVFEDNQPNDCTGCPD